MADAKQLPKTDTSASAIIPSAYMFRIVNILFVA